jgi:hypothetical protein
MIQQTATPLTDKALALFDAWAATPTSSPLLAARGRAMKAAADNLNVTERNAYQQGLAARAEALTTAA